MEGFVSRPNVGNAPVLLHAAGNLAFEKTILDENWFASLDVIFGREHTGCDDSRLRVVARGDQSSVMMKESAKSVPVSRFAGISGDHVVNRFHDAVERGNIGRVRFFLSHGD